MAELKNCLLPDDLHYHVEHNVWVRDLGDGTFELGMTDIAQSLAGNIIHCRPKKVGKVVKAGKSLGTIESGKWVGPMKAPFTAKVVARNEAAEADATILNKSPYKDGWVVRVEPAEPESALAELLSAADAAGPYEAYMAEKGLEDCIHCEGFAC